MDVSAWVAIIAAATALGSLYFTFRQAQAAERQANVAADQTRLQRKIHQDSAQPYVWADIGLDEQQGTLLRVEVVNEGPTVATNVRVGFDPPMQSTYNPENFQAIQADLGRGIKSLAPGRRLRWTYDIGPQFYESGLPTATTVTVECDGPFGPCPVLSYPLDLEDIKQSADSPAGSLHLVARSIRDLTSVLKKRG